MDRAQGAARGDACRGEGFLERLSGKGAEKITRRARAAGTLSLAIKAVGKAKRKLTRSGSAKLGLKLSFLPDGGFTGTSSRSVKLFRR